VSNTPLTEGKTRMAVKPINYMKPLGPPPAGGFKKGEMVIMTAGDKVGRSILEDFVYKVYDKETFDYWQTPKGKKVWAKTGSAKNAWNCQMAYRYGDKKFSEQDRFTVHKFSMVLVKVEEE